MVNHSTASKQGGQIAEWHASVLRQLPALGPNEMQYWIERPKELEEFLQRLITNTYRYIGIFTTDLAFRGFTVLKEGPRHPEGLEVEDLELKEFFYRDETSIKGEELQKRAKAMYANFGLHTAERILRDQHKVSKDWQDKYLVFPGTEMRHRYGDLCVPGLGWDGEQWDLGFSWLGTRFGSNARLVRASK